MALNFPDPGVSTTYVVDGVTYNYNGTKGYWSTSSIDAGGGTPNDSTITLSAGTGLGGGGAFTTNQSSNETITLNVSLSELATSTADADGDFFVVVDTLGVERKLTKGNIAISGFNNNAGFVTSSGVTSVAVTAGMGLSGGGTVTSTGTISLAVDLNEFPTSVTDGDGDYFAVVDVSGVERKLTKGNINLSGFNNDAGFITSPNGGNAATITLVATNTTNATHYLTFTDAATGNENIRTDTGLTYNPLSGLLTAGALNVGTAGTVTIGSLTIDGDFGTEVLFSGATSTFSSPIGVGSQLLDTTNAAGSSGQILSSTGTGVQWIAAPTGGTGGGITTGKAIAMAMVFG